ncbi:MAG: dTDP-4-amino-4,6-dideoxygalactose transaminase [Sediminicola sp.]|jgi:dTDP-4-amino-4,6-dideoxygalactose transaminase
MKIPFFSFEARNTKVKAEALQAFESFFDSKWYVLGKSTEQFELDYAVYNEVRYAVGVSTGLDALHLALMALGVGEGDEVIVPSNTYIATVLAVSYTGATPVFVEPRIETANLNPDLIVAAITSKTKAIMPVHLYGQPCEMDAIMDIAKKYQLFVVEDNAQAHGARYDGKITGSFGDINATSFYPTKNLGALGEAGAITTNSQQHAEHIKMLRNYGSNERYYNDEIGYNNRIDEFEAAYLNIALKHIKSWSEERRKIANWYNEALEGIDEITKMQIALRAESVYHLYVIRTNKRDELRGFLEEKGIGTQIHYPVPPHLQKAYKELGYNRGDFPVAEELADTCLSLPIWPGITKEMITEVATGIKSFFS